ncbi:MAG: 5-oxoprolinase subunit PxpB [Pseudorhodoplanes sp.]
MPGYRLLPAGDTAVVVEFGDRIDRAVNARVLACAERIAAARIEGVIEIVPTFRSLTIHYEPLVLPLPQLSAEIERLMVHAGAAAISGRIWRLPVCYDRQFALDLDEVMQRTGLSHEDIVARHSGQTYHVYMLGFLPGQAYMGDLPPEMQLSRREVPRLKIPAGSLAIAMGMTCIFPMETPCGWHLIGRSPVPLWRDDAALLTPGDAVTFAPVSLREYEDLASRAAAGTLAIAPREAVRADAA